MMKIARRSLLLGLASLVAAPVVVRSASLMPVSALKLPRLKYIVTSGVDVGSFVEVAGTAPAWMLPCDGRTISGLQFPELHSAVRGRPPREDDWINIPFEEGFKPNIEQTVDRLPTGNAAYALDYNYTGGTLRDRLFEIAGDLYV